MEEYLVIMLGYFFYYSKTKKNKNKKKTYVLGTHKKHHSEAFLMCQQYMFFLNGELEKINLKLSPNTTPEQVHILFEGILIM